MNLKKELRINWWLMCYLSAPMILYMWFKQREVKGQRLSDFGYLVDYLKRSHYVVNADIWALIKDGLIWNVMMPIGLAWILQYLFVIFWEAVRHPKARHSNH